MTKKIVSIIFCLMLWQVESYAQSFYDINTIQQIEIFFPFSNWDQKLDSASATESYIVADSVRVNGVTFDSVGVKYKGNSTYSATYKKNPFHIELDYIKGNQDYQGYTDIKLGNAWSDPSFLREPLGFYILQNYMDCPQSNFTKVFINGVSRGIYNNSETINKDFVSSHYFVSGKPFFKCNKPNFQAQGNPNLVPSGYDSVGYYAQRYEIKSDYGWTRFITMMYALKNDSATVDTILDVDRALWMHAFNNVNVNLDSYTGGFIQNYYMSEDNNGRFNPTVWDLNMCFGSFTTLSSTLTFSQMQQMSPMAQSTSTSRPLISKIIQQSRYKKQYIAHMRTMLDEMITSNNYYTTGQQLQNLISTEINADSVKFYSYNSFLTNLDTAAITSGNSTKIGIKQLLNNRKNYLLSTTEFQQVPPTLAIPVVSNTTPALNATVWITAQTSNATYAYLGLRNEHWKKFDRLPMYDDGLHQDGAANDGLYGVSIQVSSGMMEYYVYADNANAGIFSPARAEHEYYTLLASIPPISNGALVINEFMASNSTTIQDPTGSYPDWVEIFNTTNNPLSLSGLYLSDNLSINTKWAFPVTASIAANSYIIVWLDGDTLQNGYHANFKLSAGGDQLYLNYANNTMLDSVNFGQQLTDVSTGRCLNGIGTFIAQSSPTPGASNHCPTGLQHYESSNLYTLIPNPSSNLVRIMSDKKIDQIHVVNSIGQSFYNSKGGNTDFTVKNWPTGIYYVTINNQQVIKLLVD
jgi:spore coat protein CotH